MDLLKIKIDELRGLSKDRLKETRLDVQRAIVNTKMSILNTQAKDLTKVKKMKRNLARILTVETENKKSQK